MNAQTQPLEIKNIVIVGGGTAGWMAASCLARVFGQTMQGVKTITLIESEEIGTVAVGEATIPTILDFVRFLKIDEADFIRETQSTFKLAIKFADWRKKGEQYWHPFGSLGPTIENRPLYQYWIKQRNEGASDRPLMDLSISVKLSEENKFTPPDNNPQSPLSGLKYALHFNAGLVAKYLRRYSERKGVTRVEGRVSDTVMRDNGFIDAVIMEDGRRFAADFFIDCSGFRGILIDGALKAEYEDWTNYLPCDRAVAAPTARTEQTTPYTLSTAKDAGWQWRIPLQGRTGNGYVYSSKFTTDEEALASFLSSIEGEPQIEPRLLRFTGGRRREIWKANCLSLGLASGFLEPLESTSIHLIFASLFKFLDYFPDKDCNPQMAAEFNQLASAELEGIRDFLILHYCTTLRDDTPFWRYCRGMDIPASLEDRIELYREHGRIFTTFYDLFTPLSWVAVFEGMGVNAKRNDPLINNVPSEPAQKAMDNVASLIVNAVSRSPSHDDALRSLGAISP
jgi:tryptophan 7-halogenase